MTKSKQDISHELIKRGSIRHLLHGGQRKFYDMIKNNPEEQEFFLMASRRYGKSYMLALLGVEHCLQEPTARVRHVFPVLTTGKKALFDIMGQIVSELPRDMRPKLNRTEGTFTFPSGALYMIGSSHKSTMDNLRGTATTMLLADECAFWDADVFDDVLYGVLYPQMLHYPKRKAIFITTPPPTVTHPAIAKVLHKIQAKGFYMGATIYDNPRVSPQEVHKMMEMVGGETSNEWRREFLVELIADDTLRLVPEFKRELHVGEVPREDNFGQPVVFEPYIAVDVGLVDDSAYVGGYYDYCRQKLIITCEHTCTYTAFPELHQKYKNMVSNNFKNDEFLEPRCVVDIWPIAAFDLRNTYGWAFRAPRKGKLEESLAFLRDAIINNKILIHPSCTKLIFQLETAIWDEKRKEVARNAEQSHADLVMALAYNIKEIPFNTRPGDTMPLKFGLNRPMKKGFRR